MKTHILNNVDSVALQGARMIASAARSAMESHGRFTIALSGGAAPALWLMLRILAQEDIPWGNTDIFQVDERVAPDGDNDRNITHIMKNLPPAAIDSARIHPMPVTNPDLETAAGRYAALLAGIAGTPPVLDFVHLGIGPDGHTASLVPNDPVLNITDKDVAISGPYQGRTRMTMTYPLLNRARNILWLATGPDKAPLLKRLCAADPSIPAGRINQSSATLLTDCPLTS